MSGNLQISESGLNLIKSFEGLKLDAYLLSGIYHIGYGHKGATKGQTITQQQADNLLKNDLQYVVDYLNKFHFDLSQNQFDALVSFFYNVGVGRIKDVAEYIRKKDYINLFLYMNKYRFSKGVELKGLINRRTKEIEYFQRSQNQTKINYKIILLISIILYVCYKIIQPRYYK